MLGLETDTVTSTGGMGPAPAGGACGGERCSSPGVNCFGS